jgi:hypothetical protein
MNRTTHIGLYALDKMYLSPHPTRFIVFQVPDNQIDTCNYDRKRLIDLRWFEPQTSLNRVKQSTSVTDRDIPLGNPSRSYFNTTASHSITDYETFSWYVNLRIWSMPRGVLNINTISLLGRLPQTSSDAQQSLCPRGCHVIIPPARRRTRFRPQAVKHDASRLLF